LLREFGGGVAAPSANRFGRISPTTAAHVRDELGAAVSMILDGGPCAVGIESTILDLSGTGHGFCGPACWMRRPSRLFSAIRPPGRGAEFAAGFGCLEAHYAPATELQLVAAADFRAGAAGRTGAGRRIAVLADPQLLRATRGSPAIRPAPTPSASPMISMPDCVSWMHSAAT
jgi:L-threonylcarbamoyladenylate synthase